MKANELVDLNLRHFWHPCTQMKDCETLPPLPVATASGSIITLKDGRRLIDGISSWWCKSLGHGEPRVRKAFIDQLNQFEHVIMANCCTEPVAQLCEELSKLSPGLERVYLAENGSVSVEIAMKMSLQYHMQTGHPEKNLFAALHNGYHGETILTLAAGNCELYSKPFLHLCPKIPKLGPLHYLSGEESPEWAKMPEEQWKKIEAQLEEHASEIAAIVFEPILQGAAGMLIYSPDLLRRLRKWADDHGAHLIADEIMTGFGRTGKFLACEHAGIQPDFMLLSKGLTSGYCPLAAVVTTDKVYEAFYADYGTGRTFMHSTTFAGYAPAAAAALAVIRIYQEEKIVEQVAKRSRGLRARMQKIADHTGMLANVRGLGFSTAGEIINPDTGKSFPRNLRTGFRFSRHVIDSGVILRELGTGDTIYFLPPLNTPESLLDEMAAITEQALVKAVRESQEMPAK